MQEADRTRSHRTGKSPTRTAKTSCNLPYNGICHCCMHQLKPSTSKGEPYPSWDLILRFVHDLGRPTFGATCEVQADRRLLARSCLSEHQPKSARLSPSQSLGFEGRKMAMKQLYDKKASWLYTGYHWDPSRTKASRPEATTQQRTNTPWAALMRGLLSHRSLLD